MGGAEAEGGAVGAAPLEALALTLVLPHASAPEAEAAGLAVPAPVVLAVAEPGAVAAAVAVRAGLPLWLAGKEDRGVALAVGK
jgi:hypothetical protein